MRLAFLSALLATLSLTAIAGADARFIAQKTVGLRRVCFYQNRGPDRARVRETQTSVALGERCPLWYPPPRPAQPAAIPSTATLRKVEIVDGQKVCRYRHLGITYSRIVAAESRCPLTPHFFE